MVHPSRDRGSVAILVVVSTAAMALAAVTAIGHLVGDAVDGARARTAADAAALAGVTGGRARAADIAARHGATLVEWREEGDTVVVRVAVGDASAAARATTAP